MDSVATLNYEIIGLDEIFLSYAGMRSPNTKIHNELSRLKVGDALNLLPSGNKLILQTQSGFNVAHLSAKGRKRWESRLNQIQAIKVKAIVTRYKDEGEGQSKMPIRSESWEIPVVEIVWNHAAEPAQMVAEEQATYKTF
jgi:ATP-dependent DNA helicase RecQ